MITIGIIAEYRPTPLLLDGLKSCYEMDSGYPQISTYSTVVSSCDTLNLTSNAKLTINIAGKIDKCIFFGAGSNGLEQNCDARPPLHTLSFSTWIKRADYGMGADEFATIFTHKDPNKTNECFSIKIRNKNYVSGRDAIYFTFTDKSKNRWMVGYDPEVPTQEDTIWDNNWRHVVTTKAGRTIKIYIDGILKKTTTLLTSQTNGEIWSKTNKWRMAATKNGISHSDRYCGHVDQTAIWYDRELTLNDIKGLYNNGNGLPSTSWV